MLRKYLISFLAIVTLFCLGLSAQADFFSKQIEDLEKKNSQLMIEIGKKEQQIIGVEEWCVTLQMELANRIVYFEEEDILAKLLKAEAGNCSWDGQVYTCSAILNYCERNNVSIWDAAHNIDSFDVAPFVDNVTPDAVQYEVIYFVLNGGKIPDICWFRTIRYHSFGTPVCEVDDHYFSKP